MTSHLHEQILIIIIKVFIQILKTKCLSLHIGNATSTICNISGRVDYNFLSLFNTVALYHLKI